jgi:hypothetical protein
MHAASITRLGAALVFSAGVLALAPTGARAAVEAPGKNRMERVDFERHIMGLFGRMGCNAASCHGSFQGKGGFRLSLFGYDPEKDYYALTRDVLGRRINPVDPDHSLLLLKATGQIEHGGGRRFDRESWQYQAFRQWIVSGAPWRKGSGEVAGIKISPPEYAFQKVGETGQIRVLARYADNSEEDITPFCEFRTNDDAVAVVTPMGEVHGLQAGDTAVVVSYRGHVKPVRVMVPMTLPAGLAYPKVPEVNYIDREVFAKLRRLNIVPSGPAGDVEFLRRVTIDTIGCLPTPEEVRAFVADTAADKRARKIDEQLAHPMHAALWATKFCDITGNNTDLLEPPADKRSQMWHDWFRKRLADNMPYDEIVRGVLCATSRDGLSPEEWLKQVKAIDEAAQKGMPSQYKDRASLDLFWRRNGKAVVTIDQWGEKTAAAFLGVRLECAQCHKHPFDRWTQTDYRAYANIFGQLTYAVSPESKAVVDAENAERSKVAKAAGKKAQIAAIREIFIGGKGSALPNPETKRPLPPKALGGPVLHAEKGQDARVMLFDWMRAPDNPFFARSFVNRVWGHYFGVGLVDPVDNFSLANPPSNEKLLDALAKDFVDHKYDIRSLERTILNARVYQLSSDVNATNKLDHNNYSHSFVRPMMAEVVVDVLNAALGVTEEGLGKGGTSGVRAIEIGPSRVQNPNLAYAFRIFGRPPRTTACDCERAADPALPQVLYRMTDPVVLAKLNATAAKGRLHQLLESTKTDEEILDELFLATLTRLPTEVEKKHFEEYRADLKKQEKAPPEPAKPAKAEPPRKGKGAPPAKEKAPTARTDAFRQALFVDTLWALINTREFILNH